MSVLCTGRPVAHLVSKESSITDEWIWDYVMPNMLAVGLPDKV